MSRRSILLLATLVVLLAAGLTWWLTRAPLVPAVRAQMAPLVRTLQFSARVATASRVDVGSTLTGRVVQVMVREGALVRQGEVLVRLESDELRAALQQAQASERQAAGGCAHCCGTEAAQHVPAVHRCIGLQRFELVHSLLHAMQVGPQCFDLRTVHDDPFMRGQINLGATLDDVVRPLRRPSAQQVEAPPQGAGQPRLALDADDVHVGELAVHQHPLAQHPEAHRLTPS